VPVCLYRHVILDLNNTYLLRSYSLHPF
jgi:hypothetical protein